MAKTGYINASPALDAYRTASRESLRRLVQRHLELVRSLDPELHILARPVEERDIDRQLDALFERFPDPARRPPLFGVPVGFKDIIRIAGLPMGCGSLLPPVLFEGEEAACVRMMRDAGAVVFAQTATTEFAYFAPPATKNPHNPAHTPGGSSSGSAAGVAAGFFPLALGTQTVGSVIRPASFCGVTGMKPSFGKIPTAGMMYYSRSVDQAGFFCRRVADIRPVMEAFDPRWTAFDTPQRLRAGVPAGKYLDQVPAATMEWFRKVVAVLAAGGVEVVQVHCLDDIGEIAERHGDLAAAEFAVEHARWFRDYGHLYRPVTAELIARGQAVPAARIDEGRASCAKLRAELTALMQRHGLDVWVCPSAPGEAPAGRAGTGNPVMNLPWTHAGLPVISLPAGTGPGGLPMGLQCAGRFDGDDRLAADAELLEHLLCGLVRD